MSKYFIYADPESQAVLSDDSEKIILIGSDFGYGNFGDVLQHVNALKLIRGRKRFRTVSVFSTEVISSPDFPAWAKQHYQTDAVIFVSGVPHFFRDADPGIDLVPAIRGLSGLLLYGGGFLNAMWGTFVLGVAEYFLDRFPDISYWISGQQITEPFETSVLEHARRYQPGLLGVRDQHSFGLLKAGGYIPDFSFDDATESLLALGQGTLRKAQRGLFLHFNLSDYTENASSAGELVLELDSLRRSLIAGEDVTILQAFRDLRENVKDTREAIKRLESGFPLVDYRFVELPPLCYPGSNSALHRPLAGAFGYSCSYHVALWLQLSGIPCWLRSRNSFYDQKAIALGVRQTLPEFLESPALTDHRENLERRDEWLVRLTGALDVAPAVKADFEFDWSECKDRAWLYYYKGTPTLEEKLQWWTDHASQQSRQLDESALKIESLSHDLEVAVAEAQWERNRADVAEFQLRQVLSSHSWRITRPLREIAHYFRRQRFSSSQ